MAALVHMSHANVGRQQNELAARRRFSSGIIGFSIVSAGQLLAAKALVGETPASSGPIQATCTASGLPILTEYPVSRMALYGRLNRALHLPTGDSPCRRRRFWIFNFVRYGRERENPAFTTGLTPRAGP